MSRGQLVGIAVSLAVVPLHEGTASACFCEAPQRVVPETGAIGVPTNARIFVANRGSDLSLVGDGSVSVDVVPRWTAGTRSLLQVIPTAELNPLTEYRLMNGDVEVTRFTTGDGPDLAAPSPSSMRSFEIAVVDVDHGSCGSNTVAVELDVKSALDTAYYDVVFESGSEQLSYVLLPEELGELGSPSDAVCRIPVAATNGQATCVTITPRDLAGNAAPELSECREVADSGGCAIQGRGSPIEALLACLALTIARLTSRRRRSHRRTA
jgi:hypothetical protein